MITALLVAVAAIVVVRSICLAPRLDIARWTGHRAMFLGLALSHFLLCLGAVCVPIGFHWGGALMLCGCAGQVIFDRRRHDRRKFR